jgi:hypothetical protein
MPPTKKSTAPRKDRTYIMTCSDCREFWKEMYTEDRTALVNEFKEYLDERLETRKVIVERVTRHDKIISWLIISACVQGLSIISILGYLLIIQPK